MAGKGKQRTTFAKLQKERARQEKQEAKRARRHGTAEGPAGHAPEDTTPTTSAEGPPSRSMPSEV